MTRGGGGGRGAKQDKWFDRRTGVEQRKIYDLMEVWRQWAARWGIGKGRGGCWWRHWDYTQRPVDTHSVWAWQMSKVRKRNKLVYIHTLTLYPVSAHYGACSCATLLMIFKLEPHGGRWSVSRVTGVRCKVRISGGCAECGRIPIDPIPITFCKSPPCKANLLTPQSNLHKSLQHDTASESGDLDPRSGSSNICDCYMCYM